MRRRPSHGLVALLLVLASSLLTAESARAASHPTFAIRWPTNATVSPPVIEVTGLDAKNVQELQRANWGTTRWQQLFAVYAGQGDMLTDIGLPAMLGSYQLAEGRLRFEPQFPLEPGVTYRAMFRPARLPAPGSSSAAMITSTFHVPLPATNRTTVVREIYPTANVLPENLLKFYVHFSAPMRRGHIYDYIHLRDAGGKAIELPFLEIDEELWDPGMTRLTLIIDPGRIKRGVRPLEEIGPALEAGKRFTLTIDTAWKDAAGNPLKSAFEKSFQVTAPDREPPDPASWKLQPPKRGTRDPLIVQFPEPMEHALAERMIHVTDDSGRTIAGQVTLDDHERRWTFVPTATWPNATAKLIIETTIEDLAGNNIGKAFEVDLVETAPRRLARSTVTLNIRLR